MADVPLRITANQKHAELVQLLKAPAEHSFGIGAALNALKHDALYRSVDGAPKLWAPYLEEFAGIGHEQARKLRMVAANQGRWRHRPRRARAWLRRAAAGACRERERGRGGRARARDAGLRPRRRGGRRAIEEAGARQAASWFARSRQGSAQALRGAHW